MTNIFSLSRAWFDFCFENTDRINPTHTALYFFIIEHNNRLGWKEKFGLPVNMAMDAIGVKNYRTYSKAFTDLVEWKFVKLHTKSTNQYSANVIALVKNTKAITKANAEAVTIPDAEANTGALTKAMQKHSQKHVQSIADIDIPNTIIPNTNIEERKLAFADSLKPFLDEYGKEMIRAFYNYWTEPNKSKTKFKQEFQKTWDTAGRLRTWKKRDQEFNKNKNHDKSTIQSNIDSTAKSVERLNKIIRDASGMD